MTIKYLLSIVAIVLTFIAFWPYIRSIHQGKTKPHLFSWIIWGSTTFIVFLAQLSAKGGVGAWPIGISGLITLYVAYLAYIKQSDDSITRIDWFFLIAAISALPFWYLTANPLWAVVILTITDLLGFGPTFRKSYHSPFEEKLSFFSLITIRNFISILALESYSLTTVLFPAASGGVGLIFILMVLYLRHKLVN